MLILGPDLQSVFGISGPATPDPDARPLEQRLGITFDSTVPDNTGTFISPHIETQLPEFVRSNHATFSAFLEAYYEWLEQSVNVFGRTTLLQDITDIDKTLDEFVVNFKRQYLLNFPETLATDVDGNKVNEATLIKNIRDFYGTKGSEKAYQFLFRVLYDSDCGFYYPKTDILKASDGFWVQETAIKVTSINGLNNFKMRGRSISQIDRFTLETTATARVTRVNQYSIGPHEVTELFLDTIVGEFNSGENIECELEDGTVLGEVTYGLFSDITVTDAGEKYRLGDKVIPDESAVSQREIPFGMPGGEAGFPGGSGGILGSPNVVSQQLGLGGTGKITEVSLKGSVKNAIVDNGGVNYTEPIPVRFVGGNGAGRGVMTPRATITYTGYYKNNNGKLSSNKRLQDNEFYQDFSYVLKAETSLDTYREVIRKLIHPAGLRVFGNISIFKEIKSLNPFHAEKQSYEIPIIGHYTPYRFETTANLRANGVTAAASGPGAGFSGATGNSTNGQTFGDLYFIGYNPGSTSNYHVFGETGGKLIVRGPSLTAGSFFAGLQVSGDTSGASGEVYSFHVFTGTAGDTLGILRLSSIPGSRPDGFTAGELIGVTSAAASGTAAGGGWTAEIINILAGSGIVSESLDAGHTLAGIIGHDSRGTPLGTAGTDGVTQAAEYYRLSGLTATYDFWTIYHHPNTRGFSGDKIAGGFTQGIDEGLSFDRVPLRTFLRMPVGYHYHSDPSSTSLYYNGSSSDSIYYSVPYGSTNGSPNLTHT